MFRKIALSLGVAALSLSAAACNTVKGLGEDIQSVGQSGEDAID
ncbi:entericidin A/B family lipoprotein [Pontixanthobacter aquaemixtae]|uniref:Entericidin A/B family lipoprotein n=1 Tax=Pontixanthobacter aquaemixtae TaxID=1958940 RepID=A0A844ZPI7_9SPHN|nr:entericidin A/B family lipoprotein [Pontixanthobacter aquaemixtae]MXO89658.1 entericidin A/B family lipoprotein [Pontixanthobacter aquaemixtae]